MLRNIVFVGAGGTGMSGLAMMLFDLGYHNIVCINDVENDLTDKLSEHGLHVRIGHGKYEVDFHDFVIYADIQAIIDGPELQQSRIHQQHTTKKFYHITLSYAQMLAEISKLFVTIGVAGSNGKTSTSAMTMWVLSQLTPEKFGLGLLGGLLPNFQNQGYALAQDKSIQSDITQLFEHLFHQKHQLDYHLLKKYFFVLEAGEYRDHFLRYDLDYTLITNIERDHRDYFPTRQSYTDAFKKVIGRTRYHTIATQQVFDTLETTPDDRVLLSGSFDFKNDYLIGSYNESNAGLVESLLGAMGKHEHITLSDQSLQEILSSFKGAGRRMEYLGTLGEKMLYSDYGHHAPALEGNIRALKTKFPDKKLCVIFQPHQAQRVLAGWDDFRDALAGVDTTIVYRLYTARENFQELQTHYPHLSELSNFEELGHEFAAHLGGDYITSIDELLTRLDTLPDNTVIVYFSAGDLDREMRKSIYGQTIVR